MTLPAVADPATDTPPGETTSEPVFAVADQFVRLMRTFGRARDHYHADTSELEWHPSIVLKAIKHFGPLRLGHLADQMRLDPSTLSRHVSSLVKDGYVERAADQDDGRASVLRTTAKAEPVLAEMDAKRVEFFRSVLSDWSDEDIRRFADGLARFETDFRREIDRQATDHTASAPSATREAHEAQREN